ncbi:MAG: hypothetical protein COA84_14265 [Robiginitomaculum sp.]|nr:MAG: hypothetical protein COA84_14265 [Robiginitomaculum sp.]
MVDLVTGEVSYTLIQDGSSPVKLTSESEEKFKAALGKAINDNRSNGVNPIETPVSEKIDMVNQKFTDLGLTAHVTQSADGKSYLVYGDGESIALNDLDADGIADIKERATKAIKEDQITPVTPIEGEKPEPTQLDRVVAGLQDKAAELREEYTGERAQQYVEQQQTRDDAQDKAFNEFKFETQADIANLYNEIDRLDEKMDGVMAGTHAINNARPFLTRSGQTAVGVGAGFAGNSGAIAIGAAHSFNENWSTSMTVNITTGSYSEVSGGAGVQYIF